MTQEITAFKILGLRRIWSDIYLVDVPGFADQKISEMRIIAMIRNWVNKNISPVGTGVMGYILYLDRITDTRVAGSKKKLIALFKELLGPGRAKSVTIITTMWDELWTEAQRERAENRYRQLESEHWKDLIDQGAKIVKFQNTQESAFQILHNVVKHLPNSKEYAGLDSGKPIRKTSAGIAIYGNLLERIEARRQRLRAVEEDLKAELTIANRELFNLLAKERTELDRDLQMFEKELEEFGPPPDPKPEPQPRKHLGIREKLDKTKQRLKHFWGKE
ncbi:hypothetical protein BJ165DRAFT_1495954 [Panaeolus papilionaceus]|nr:hypothetical protein BJ165DRAFT_1495954 [Panaeolus papilionaceus]